MPTEARRILIYGVTGAGKTSFASRLSAATGISWTEVDSLTWEPGWVEVELGEQRRRIEAICERDAWILDSAYSKWIDIPLQRVELIVGLDYARWVSLARLMVRTLRRAIDKKPICNGNIEKFSTMFSRDSILLWHFKSYPSKTKRIRDWESRGDPEVLRFKRPREAERFLADL